MYQRLPLAELPKETDPKKIAAYKRFKLPPNLEKMANMLKEVRKEEEAVKNGNDDGCNDSYYNGLIEPPPHKRDFDHFMPIIEEQVNEIKRENITSDCNKIDLYDRRRAEVTGYTEEHEDYQEIEEEIEREVADGIGEFLGYVYRSNERGWAYGDEDNE